MSKQKHGSENVGWNLRDRKHPRTHYLRRAHRDWRVWVALGLMLTAMLIYVLSDGESLVPGNPRHQPMPADVAP